MGFLGDLCSVIVSLRPIASSRLPTSADLGVSSRQTAACLSNFLGFVCFLISGLCYDEKQLVQELSLTYQHLQHDFHHGLLPPTPLAIHWHFCSGQRHAEELVTSAKA